MTVEKTQINKPAIRNFSIQARNILIKSAVTEAGFYGVTKDGIKDPIQKGLDFEVYETLAGTEKRIFGSDLRRRANLAAAVRRKGFDQVMEETAYTWFNRLIAIRFMEVNKYLPFRMRVLSSDSGSLTPDIVSRSLDVDLHMTEEELAAVQKAKEENRYDEAFRLLFLKACNELHAVLPGLFEETDDYMELLLNLPYTSDGVVRMLVDTIPESNFNVREGGQVEIIGWLYQYYNTEPKAKVFAKKGKITKEEIPAVTQLFTPDWIVRYMVENSLGRLWIEHLLANGDSRSEQEIADYFGWKYYLPEAEQKPDVQAQLVQIRTERKDMMPEDILCIDPCQGSGHILVYFFEVLMQIYREEGHSERDAARSILEHNLYGLDIDDRAYQLSYFAVLMKAKKYDRMILKKQIEPHVYSIQESNTVDRNQLKYFGADMNEFDKNNALNQLTGLLDTFIDAKEYGSILNVDPCDWDLLRQFVENDRVEGQYGLDAYDLEETQKQLKRLVDIGEVMAQKYHVVCTNPPYMSVSASDAKLYSYVIENYQDSKNDLYSVFIEKGLRFSYPNGYLAMITQQAWMFNAIYSDLREKLKSSILISLLQMGAHGFDEIGGEVVQTATFVFRKLNVEKYSSTYFDLTSGGNEKEKATTFFSGKNRYQAVSEDFINVPNGSMAYWMSHNALVDFGKEKLSSLYTTREGMTTANNDEFLREWFEVSVKRIGFGCSDLQSAQASKKKWFPYNKGGNNRKWYGNADLVVNWENDGLEIRNIKDPKTGRIRSHNYNGEYSFKESGTWTAICSGDIMVRYSPEGALFDSKGASGFAKDHDDLLYFIGLLNSKISSTFLKVLSPAYEYKVGHVANVPLIIRSKAKVNKLVEKCISIAKMDWDSQEISWDFRKDPLIDDKITGCSKGGGISLLECFRHWESECNNRKKIMKDTEEEINRIFIPMYELDEELTPEVDITTTGIRSANVQRDIKDLLSYAVGCMFGRYSLDVDGLAYAGGDWQEAFTTKYKSFIPDEDAIIPITDEEYFKDDIVARFVDFVRIVYGEETLEENLKFIADALGNKGDTSRAVIRNYFLNDFYKDHCNTYSVTGSGKRPIYWLFDSGKQNGFKALIYIHRYTPDTVGLIRSKYLHNAQAAIQNALQNSEYIIASTTSATERARETKKRDKYVKQLNELRPYYQALTHIALQRIPMDPDDGVKKNYQLFQNVEISTEGKKKQSINLLAKI